MPTLTDYRGLQIVTPEPLPGLGGSAIQGDFKTLVNWHPKSTWDAADLPDGDVNNEDEDYYPGSFWMDVSATPPEVFVCQSSTDTTATWVRIVTANSTNDVGFHTITASGNLLLGTTADVTTNGDGVLVFGNKSNDPTFAASTYGLWVNTATLKTNAGSLHLDPTGTNASATMFLDRAGAGVAQWRFYTNGVPRWVNDS